jgi:cell shape-determining protein MreC
MIRIPVEGNPNLVRDPITKAVINTNMDGYLEYINSSKKLKERNQKLDAVADEVTQLKNEISEIKQMLISVLSSSAKAS